MEHPMRHISHVEDLFVYNGREGIQKSVSIFVDIVASLWHNQKFPDYMRVTEKFDGANSIVFGMDGADFFIGTKSALSKTPEVFKSVDELLSKTGGVYSDLYHILFILECSDFRLSGFKKFYQADLMYLANSSFINYDTQTFTPNCVTYHPKNFTLDNYPLVLAVHSVYEGSLGNLKLTNEIPHKPESDSVKFLDVEVQPKGKMQDDRFSKIVRNISVIKYLLNDIPESVFDFVKTHAEIFNRYFNYVVKKDLLCNNETFLNYISVYYDSKRDNLKKETSKEKYENLKTQFVGFVESNKFSMVSLFKIHNAMVTIKNSIILELDKTRTDFIYTIDGNLSAPEGYVVTHANTRVKLVNRSHFSFHNFRKHRETN